MRIVPLSEVLQLQAGETIPSVRGVLTEIYQQNTGENSHGPWALQNVFLQNNGTKVKVKLADHPPIPPESKGRILELRCNDGERGLTGIKAKDDEYRGKVSRIIHVTASAHVTVIDPTSQPAEPEPPPPHQSAQPNASGGYLPPDPRPQPVPPPPQQPAHNLAADKVRNAAKGLARSYYRVMEAVEEMRVAWDTQHADQPMTAEHVQAARSTLYIQLGKEGVINGNGH